MTEQFFAEYNSAREHRMLVEKARHSAFLWGIACGMVICLGLLFGLAQFKIYLG